MRKLPAFAVVVALAGCSSAMDVTAAEKGTAQETFVYHLSPGQAQLIGYNINSDLLIIH